MKRLTIVGLLMGCAEPKIDVDSEYEEEPGATEATPSDEGSDEELGRESEGEERAPQGAHRRALQWRR